MALPQSSASKSRSHRFDATLCGQGDAPVDSWSSGRADVGAPRPSSRPSDLASGSARHQVASRAAVPPLRRGTSPLASPTCLLPPRRPLPPRGDLASLSIPPEGPCLRGVITCNLAAPAFPPRRPLPPRGEPELCFGLAPGWAGGAKRPTALAADPFPLSPNGYGNYLGLVGDS